MKWHPNPYDSEYRYKLRLGAVADMATEKRRSVYVVRFKAPETWITSRKRWDTHENMCARQRSGSLCCCTPTIPHENEVDGRTLQDLLLCCLHHSAKTLPQARSSVVSGEIDRQRLTCPSRGAIALK
jgi:hypothetical protein